MAVTNLDVQTELKKLGYYDGDLDGLAGPKTAAAVIKFQEDKNLPVTGKLDPKSLAALFPGPVAERPKTIKGVFMDYVLNFLKSKTTWAAGALVTVMVTWTQTRFGFTIPQELQGTISALIVAGFTALIGALQAAPQTPHMTSKQPAVVQRPAEFTGQEKK